MVDPHHLKQIFDKAADLPRTSRGTFLDQACGQDASMRQEVELLLRAMAEGSGFSVHTCADETELVEVAAGLIADGLVTGWYQGRSEWGPRALGNRSILANPAIQAMKDTINAKIKRFFQKRGCAGITQIPILRKCN